MAKSDRKITQPNIKNRRAGFEFELLQEFTAGMQLTGTEIKSIREGKAAITDAYCVFSSEELVVRNMTIQEYTQGNIYNHEPKRDRKLLLKKVELNKLKTKLKDKGLTIIPIQLFISETGFAKLIVSLAKGKKLYDKRESLKKKDITRDIARGGTGD
jgi:SsrA-binding protein